MSFGSLGAAGSGWQVAVVTRQDGPMPHEPIRYRSADEDRWRVLVAAASFASMRSRANEITPNTLGVLKDNAAFFRATGRGGLAAPVGGVRVSLVPGGFGATSCRGRGPARR
jgi:hypothetical protein